MQQISLSAECGIGAMNRLRVILASLEDDIVHGAAQAAQVGFNADTLRKVEQALHRRLVQIGLGAVAGDLLRIKKRFCHSHRLHRHFRSYFSLKDGSSSRSLETELVALHVL